ncbi:hypothetical protein I4F81_008611 [Pyropia yezoensis]|uniref:Uncharacterized protein n=1 Tax=Pyropia yezoensis TaxID=2788 RepID=A0ACC3C8L8_PYRYE|nr:hypothetical protein I4F81_008611 [Neopyropia yezoensis]
MTALAATVAVAAVGGRGAAVVSTTSAAARRRRRWAGEGGWVGCVAPAFWRQLPQFPRHPLATTSLGSRGRGGRRRTSPPPTSGQSLLCLCAVHLHRFVLLVWFACAVTSPVGRRPLPPRARQCGARSRCLRLPTAAVPQDAAADALPAAARMLPQPLLSRGACDPCWWRRPTTTGGRDGCRTLAVGVAVAVSATVLRLLRCRACRERLLCVAVTRCRRCHEPPLMATGGGGERARADARCSRRRRVTVGGGGGADWRGAQRDGSGGRVHRPFGAVAAPAVGGGLVPAPVASGGAGARLLTCACRGGKVAVSSSTVRGVGGCCHVGEAAAPPAGGASVLR